MKIGICVLFNIDTFELLLYCFDSYELAKEQAKELMKGVVGYNEILDTKNADNGMMESGYITNSELIMAKELEVGTKVIPVVTK